VSDEMAAGPVCTWEAPGEQPLTFPVSRIEETGGNRLAPRERIYRDGAKYDDTGSKPDGYQLTCAFFNGHREQGVPGDKLYPDQLRALMKACRVHACGTLTLPTVGPKRCRADHWTRTDDPENRRDYATLSISFVLDNEDDQTASSFVLPTARATAVALANEVLEDLDALGVVSDDTVSLGELCGQLEELANAPAEFADDINEKVAQITGTIDRIGLDFDNTARLTTEPATLLLQPSAAPAHAKLARLADLAARARSGLPQRTRLLVFARVVSLLDVAAEQGQDVSDLIALNPQYEDLSAIPARAPIRVYTQAP
jgi:prophage DNA circulation protein